jgi:hypothetical protein
LRATVCEIRSVEPGARNDRVTSATRGLGRPQAAADDVVEPVARAPLGVELDVERDRLHEVVELLGEHLGGRGRVLEEVEVAGVLLGEAAHQAEVGADAGGGEADAALTRPLAICMM